MRMGTWLLAMVQPLIGRILVTLGFSVVSIVGMDVTLNALKAQFLAQAGLVPAAGLQMALLAGVGEGMGIIFGACATRLALWQIKNTARILGVNT